VSATVAYRSDHPDVLAAWAAYGAEHKRFGAEVDALTADLFPGDNAPGAMVQHGWAWRYGQPVPDGWKYEGKSGVLSPKVSTKIGKAIRKRFPKPVPACSLPGMPTTDMSHLPHIYAPGVEQHDGALYATWAVEPNEPVDPAIWTRIKMSEYYAAREADPEYGE
jgi:hypothetical protein